MPTNSTQSQRSLSLLSRFTLEFPDGISTDNMAGQQTIYDGVLLGDPPYDGQVTPEQKLLT